jgi:superfamily II DNA/RNA helicase
VHRIGRTGRAGLTGEAISLVSQDDHEALGAIEKLIKKKIEKVVVAGFAPHAGTAATLMGGESRGHRGGSRGERGDRRPAREEHRQRGGRERMQQPSQAPRNPPPATKSADPIFSKPYEPSAPSTEPKPQQPQSSSRRRERPVAALLGGLKR